MATPKSARHDRLFLDANILFPAAYSPESGVASLWKQGAELLTSLYALEEARRNLDTTEQQETLHRLMEEVSIVSESDFIIPTTLSIRVKDRPILSAALAAGATHLITGDFRDFGSLFGKKIGVMTVLPPAAYLKLRGSKRSTTLL